jgi:hypothetical protein
MQPAFEELNDHLSSESFRSLANKMKLKKEKDLIELHVGRMEDAGWSEAVGNGVVDKTSWSRAILFVLLLPRHVHQACCEFVERKMKNEF